MPKLNQIIAVVTGLKPRVQRAITDIHQLSQKTPLFFGHKKTYRPKDEEGEQYPPEHQVMQASLPVLIGEAKSNLAQLWDAVATQEHANQIAEADLVYRGTVLARLPVSFLLFLEKQLTDLQTFVAKLPTLPADSEWSWSAQNNQYQTEPYTTFRTKKVPRPLVKYEATKEHPAQVELVAEDIVVGEWSQIRFSSAIPDALRKEKLSDIAEMIDAVKLAREQANGIDATQIKVADAILSACLQGLPQS